MDFLLCHFYFNIHDWQNNFELCLFIWLDFGLFFLTFLSLSLPLSLSLCLFFNLSVSIYVYVSLTLSPKTQRNSSFTGLKGEFVSNEIRQCWRSTFVLQMWILRQSNNKAMKWLWCLLNVQMLVSFTTKRYVL